MACYRPWWAVWRIFFKILQLFGSLNLHRFSHAKSGSAHFPELWKDAHLQAKLPDVRKENRNNTVSREPSRLIQSYVSSEILFVFVKLTFIRRRKHKLGDETEFFKAEIEISKEPYGKKKLLLLIHFRLYTLHPPLPWLEKTCGPENRAVNRSSRVKKSKKVQQVKTFIFSWKRKLNQIVAQSNFYMKRQRCY